MQNYSLITSLVTGFGLALPFGYLAERFLRSPALVGYILAGVAVGIIPGLPPVNEAMIEQLAEIGVMLLMFGVGLHFSVRDLLNVRTAVVPWAAVHGDGYSGRLRRHGFLALVVWCGSALWAHHFVRFNGGGDEGSGTSPHDQ